MSTQTTNIIPRGARLRWLVPGGALAVITVAVFVATMTLNPLRSTIGIAVAVTGIAAMLISSLTARDPRAYAGTLAGVMAGMGAISAVLLLSIFLWPA